MSMTSYDKNDYQKNGKNKDDFHYLKEICHWEKKKILLNIHTRIITFNDTYLLLLDSKKPKFEKKKLKKIMKNGNFKKFSNDKFKWLEN